MFKIIARLMVCLTLVFGGASSSALAADRATPDEAKAMAERAAAFLKEQGPEKAYPAFNAPTPAPEWKDRDLYVFVLDANGVALAHGASKPLIGRAIIDLKDVDGKPFVRDMLAVQERGWVNYNWRNPVSQAMEPKTSYIVKVNGLVVGVGAYK